MNINGILKSVQGFAPEHMAAEWDNSGVNVAGSAKFVDKLAVALDPTPGFVREALDWGAQFLVTHHPLYFQAPAPDHESPYLDILRMLLPAGAWHYCAHTSLDACPGGPAQWLGRALGLEDAEVLEPLGDDAEIGFGQVGRLLDATNWNDFEHLLSTVLRCSEWREMGTVPESVRTVAYLPGSGASAAKAAAVKGADVFITGDFKYHQALEVPLCVLDVGHHVIEEEMIFILAQGLDEALEKVDVRFFSSADPFRFRKVERQ